MLQISLFDIHILKSAHLVAPLSPRQAFYNIWIEKNTGKYLVCKRSGGKNCVMDFRRWVFDTFEEADGFYTKKIKQKTDPRRRSIRKYIVV
jgi:hypothetical protein